ncbi:MerR family transcriptional regulator [soil metagenome]
MPYKETETVKLYFSIGEVAKLFNVNASLLRFWEKEFDIIKPKKNKKGDRMFTQEDVSNFRTIYHLVKERGYTLQGAKEKLKGNKKNETSDNVEMVKSLEKVKGFLLELKSQL